MSKYLLRLCDSCGCPVDSNGMCHTNPRCVNFCEEYPQNDRDEYDERRERADRIKLINPDATSDEDVIGRSALE